MMEQHEKAKQNGKKVKMIRLSSEQQQKMFQFKQFIGRGTFGSVYSAFWKTNELDVAIKSVAKNTKYKNRQVQILNMLKHPSIIGLLMSYEKVEEVKSTLKGGKQKQKVYTNLVMEYVPKTLLSLIRSGNKQEKISYDVVVEYSRKLIEGLAYLQENNVCHRDIKPSNVLIDETNGRFKICDFGSAKQLKSGEKSITYICSRYYRAPELVLGCTEYTTKIDIWSAGCVIAEMITMQPLFDGDDNLDQIAKIIKVLGPPTKQDLQAMKVENFNDEFLEIKGIGLHEKIKKANSNCPQQMLDMLSKLIVYDPDKRMGARQALEHPAFKKQSMQIFQ